MTFSEEGHRARHVGSKYGNMIRDGNDGFTFESPMRAEFIIKKGLK